MAKYNYDKSALKGYGVGPFLNEVKVREEHIEAAPAEEIRSIFNANIVGAKLHPHIQMLKIARVEEIKDGKVYTLVANKEKGTEELAYFRAGQYLSVVINIGKAFVSKPYTLASNPKDALGANGSYRILVKDAANGYASDYVHENWKEGTEVMTSGPLGNYYYQELRDAKHVVAASGGSGITPFISMAHAVAEGLDDYRLTLLIGNKTWEHIPFRAELEELEKNCDKIKVVHVLSEEDHDGCEKGFISADIIRKYAGNDDYSLFICGNAGFYKFMYGVVQELGLPIRRARFEVGGEYGDPSQNEQYCGDPGAEYKLTVWTRGEKHELTCRGDETLVHAIQAAGIAVTTDCRSGICGWCHSRLITGSVYIPEDRDGRREADKKFGWIHPCITYPLSDIEMEAFPVV